MTMIKNGFKHEFNIRLVSSLLFLCFSTALFAQSPYQLSWKKEAPLIGAGVGTQLVAMHVQSNRQGLTEEEIGLLDKNDINSFDRFATNYYSSSARLTSDILLASSCSIPFLFLANKKTRSGIIVIGVMTAEVVLVNGATTNIVKQLAKRTRPFAYNADVGMEEKIALNARTSFYSGHTSAVTSICFFGAKVFNDYFPESQWKKAVWTVAIVLPAATGYARVAGGKHFPTDVIVGYVAGAAVGYFVPQWHRKKDKDKKVGVTVYPGLNSLGITMTW